MRRLFASLQTLYRRKALLYNLLLIIALCLAITLVLIEFVYIGVTRDLLVQTLHDATVNVLFELSETKHALDESMISTSYLIYNNHEFGRLSRERSLSGYYSLNTCAQLVNQFLYANPYFKSIAMYLPNSGRMITTDYGVYMDAAEYFDQEIIRFYQDEAAIRTIERRTLTPRYNNQTFASMEVKTIMVKLYMDTRSAGICTAVLTINADYQQAYYNMTRGQSAESGKHFFILYQDETLFSTTDSDLLTDELLARIAAAGGQSISFRSAGHTWMVTSFSDDQHQYIAMTPTDSLDRSVGHMTRLTLFSCGLIFVICLAVAAFFSRKTIRPIERAVLALEDQGNLTFLLRQPSDIAQTISRIGAYTNQLHEQLYSSLPLMREDFLRDITQSQPSLDASSDELLSMLELDFLKSGLSLAIMDIDRASEPVSTLAESVLVAQSIQTLARSWLVGNGCRFDAYAYDADTTVIVIDASQTSPRDYLELFDGLKQHVREVAGVTASFVVCEDIDTLLTLHASFRRCQELRSYRRLYRKGYVLTCKKESAESRVRLSDYPIECENRLITAIVNTDLHEAIIQLDALLGSIAHMQSILFLQNFINNFIVRLANILRLAKKDPNEILGSTKVNSLFRTEHYLDDVRERLMTIIEITIEQLTEASPNKAQHYYEKIQAYIGAHYMRDISLTDIGGHLGISPNYVNTIIRSCADMTFVQLLTRRRIDAACDLLKNSRLSVGEISEQIGFSSTRYFIQVFKKHVGTTPGQYR